MSPSLKPLAWSAGRFYWLLKTVKVSYKAPRRLVGVMV